MVRAGALWVRVRLPLLFVALGLAALVAIGVGKLVGDHRKARLEDAFVLLAAGLEHLKNSDTAGALQRVQGSIGQFRAAGRDPVIALHHALAARLRSHTPGLRESRELFVAHWRGGEVALALALSPDSTLLAVATPQRLACLLTESGRWAEWELPERIKSAETLHVDSVTGKAHVVVGDDGKVLSADCRAPGSPLV